MRRLARGRSLSSEQFYRLPCKKDRHPPVLAAEDAEFSRSGPKKASTTESSRNTSKKGIRCATASLTAAVRSKTRLDEPAVAHSQTPCCGFSGSGVGGSSLVTRVSGPHPEQRQGGGETPALREGRLLSRPAARPARDHNSHFAAHALYCQYLALASGNGGTRLRDPSLGGC